MTLIHNYIYKEVTMLTAAIIGVLTFLLVSLNLFKVIGTILNTDLPLWLAVKFAALLVPFVLTLAIPTGLLAAVLIAFGRMSSDRELLALKASGVGLAPIVAPVVVMAMGLSLVNYWLVAYVTPECRKESSGILHEMVVNNPLSLFTPGVIIDKIPGYRIFFEKKTGTELEDVHIWMLDQQGDLSRSVRADKAQVALDLEHQQLVMTLFNEREEQYPPNGVFSKVQPGARAEQLPVAVSLSSFYEKVQNRISWMTLTEIEQVILSMETAPTGLQASPYLTEFQARVSFSIACFTFVLVGIPLAIQTQRRETSAGVVLAIVIVGVYFVIGAVAKGLKMRSGLYPELIIWMPNLIFQAIGAWLFYRANRR